MNENGAIFYDGPSQLDGVPIIGIVTGLKKPSKNIKTDWMLQTWILLRDIAPNIASKNGADISICGTCKHRYIPPSEKKPARKRSCYVIVHQAPLSVWKCYRKGNYSQLNYNDVKGKQLRLGSYGDPAAIPLNVWEKLKKAAEVSSHTGYTHQWKVYPEYGSLCMASVDNAKERNEARSLGLRTFRVRRENQRINKKMEFVCPASEEGSKKTTCEKCGLCNGLESKTNKSPVIIAHGSFAVNF